MDGRQHEPLKAGKVLHSSASADISNALVRIFRDYLGRGPTKARTYIQENLVVCLLQDTLTKAELTLAANSKSELVLTMRRTFQQTMREPMCEVVAEIMGREVVTFMSDNSINPDFASEIFVLEPVHLEAVADPA